MVNNETKIAAIALKTIELEMEAIGQLKSAINADFCRVVDLIFNNSGRLVVTGIGKSALIARKLVATLNSTGTPSLFMHASDAIHGDIGMVQKGDIVLCISKSGETAELKVLIPLIKNLPATLVAMTSKSQGYLAKRADHTLLTPVNREADPNDLAPTTSTTTQLVMSDALAMALLSLRKFTSTDFALVHPAGMLGKQLHLRVRDFNIKNEKPQILPTASIQEVIVEISSKRLGATAVVDEKGTVLGIITDGDLRRMLEKSTDFNHLTAQDIMTASPKTVDVAVLATEALAQMKKGSITQLIVQKKQHYQGIIHLHDLLKEGFGKI